MVLVKNLKFLWCFLLRTFILEKVFGDVIYRKLAFFDHKNIDLKKSQNLHFSKRVSAWFLVKNFKLVYFLFVNKFGLCTLFGGFLYRKVAFLNHWNTGLKRSQNLHFFKVVSPWFWSKILNFFSLFPFRYISPRKSVWWPSL